MSNNRFTQNRVKLAVIQGYYQQRVTDAIPYNGISFKSAHPDINLFRQTVSSTNNSSYRTFYQYNDVAYRLSEADDYNETENNGPFCYHDNKIFYSGYVHVTGVLRQRIMYREVIDGQVSAPTVLPYSGTFSTAENVYPVSGGGKLWFVGQPDTGVAKVYSWDGTTLVECPSPSDVSVSLPQIYGLTYSGYGGGRVYFNYANTNSMSKRAWTNGTTTGSLPSPRTAAQMDFDYDLFQQYFYIHPTTHKVFYVSMSATGFKKIFCYHPDTNTYTQCPDTRTTATDDVAVTMNAVQEYYSVGSYTMNHFFVGNNFMFVANNSGGFSKLWAYDGATRTQVPEIRANTVTDAPKMLRMFNGALYYAALNSSGVEKLFFWNGTTRSQVTETNATATSDAPLMVGEWNGGIYYSAMIGGATSRKLFRWDGTTRTQISNIVSGGTDGLTERDYIITTSGIYFMGNSPTGGFTGRLYKWNGTSVVQFPEVRAGENELWSNLIKIGDKVGIQYREPAVGGASSFSNYTWDGTTKTKVFGDVTYLTPVYSGALTQTSAELNGNLIYPGVLVGGTPVRTYIWDGITLKSLPSTTGNNASGTDVCSYHYAYNGKVYFRSNNSGALAKSYVWDGVSANATAIAATTTATDAPGPYIGYGNSVYYPSNNASNVSKLYRYDGTSVTQILQTRSAATVADSPTNFCVSHNRLYYSSLNANGVAKLYYWDGTTRGQVAENRAATLADSPTALFNFNNVLYYWAINSAGFWKLFKFDGTTKTQVSDTFVGNNDGPGTLNQMVVHNNELYFASMVAASSWKLYKYDGTTVTQVTNMMGGTVNDAIDQLCTFAGALYFQGKDSLDFVQRVYKWDGATVTLVSQNNPSQHDVNITANHRYIMSFSRGVVWWGIDVATGGTEIYIHNGATTRKMDLWKGGADSFTYPQIFPNRIVAIGTPPLGSGAINTLVQIS